MMHAQSQPSRPSVVSPLPLSFLAQAVASASLAVVQLHWIPATAGSAVAWSILLLTVPLQLLAAVMAFVAHDAAAATSAGLLAGGWASIAVVRLASPPGSTSTGLGVVLVAVAGALLVPASAAVTRLAAAAVVLVCAARFAATGVHQLTALPAWETVAGWIGLALAALSAYTALALELRATFGVDVLPVGRLRTAEGG